MKNPKRINSLEELRLEKRKLQMEMEITRKAIAQKSIQIRSEARGFLMRKLLIPLGLTAIATFVANQWSNSNGGEKFQFSDITGNRSFWADLLSHVGEFFIKYFQHSQAFGATENEYGDAANPKQPSNDPDATS